MKLYVGVVLCILFVVSRATIYDGCCSYPCQNLGVCMSEGDGNYECDCTKTGYYGSNCEKPFWTTRLKNYLRPSKESLFYFLTHFDFFWDIINNITWIRWRLMRAVLAVRIGPVSEPPPYSAMSSYPAWDTYVNRSVYARSLPPIPENCPTAMGVKGKKELPDPMLIAEKLFARKKFEPCPERTNVIFPLFAQHFTHQFFKTTFPKGMPDQWGFHNVDLSHVYGHSVERQHGLRLHQDGKMKFSMINGEMFPPTIRDAQVPSAGAQFASEKYQFAFGHPGFMVSPTFLVFSTLWLREHNRVCDQLKGWHPSWDDERLFQTARLIVTGEMIKVVIEDYIQHMSGFNFKLLYDPEMLHHSSFSYHNHVHVEFQLLYRWHALVPDYLRIDGNAHSMRSLLFNPKPFVDAGMEAVIRSFTNQFAGRVQGGRNQGRDTLAVCVQGIKDSRKMRIQPLNNYRTRFGMKPFKSFSEMTSDPQMAKDLEEMYGDIDAVEYVVGIFLESNRSHAMFAETMAEIGAPYSLKGLMGNPIGSPGWWKPSTFGGEKGMEIIKTVSLQELVCRNVKGCPRISFTVPDGLKYEEERARDPDEEGAADILIKSIRGYSETNSAPPDAKPSSGETNPEKTNTNPAPKEASAASRKNKAKTEL